MSNGYFVANLFMLGLSWRVFIGKNQFLSETNGCALLHTPGNDSFWPSPASVSDSCVFKHDCALFSFEDWALEQRLWVKPGWITFSLTFV